MHNMTFGLEMFCAFDRMNTVFVRWMSRCLHQNEHKLLKNFSNDTDVTQQTFFLTTRYSWWDLDPPPRFWVRTTKHAM